MSKKEVYTVHPVGQTALGGEERTAYPVAPAMAQKRERRVYFVARTVTRKEERAAYPVALVVASKEERTAPSVPPTLLRKEETTAYPGSFSSNADQRRKDSLCSGANDADSVFRLALLTVYAVALAVWSAEEKAVYSVALSVLRTAHLVAPLQTELDDTKSYTN